MTDGPTSEGGGFVADIRDDLLRWIQPQSVARPDELKLPLALALLFRHMPARAMLAHRLGEWAHRKRIPILQGFFQRWNLAHYGIEIWSQDGIAGGLYVAHPVGCVIAARRIGRNCTIIASVTIGLRTTYGFPTIGDDVFIGTGARILGEITIGDGARIGANAVVLADVPPGATAVGIPARILPQRSSEAPRSRSDDAAAQEIRDDGGFDRPGTD